MKALTAWVTSAWRSARNSTRFTQLARISRSTSAMAVRVLPAPVAMTSSACAPELLLEGLTDPADRPHLVVAADDLVVDRAARRAPGGWCGAG